MGKEHIKDPGVLTPFSMKWNGNKAWVPWSNAIIWYHGISAKEWCKRKYCGFDWWIIMINLFVPGLLFYFILHNFIFCDSLPNILYLEICTFG